MARFRCFIATALVLAGCGERTTDFYIVIDADRAASFAPELASIAREQDFSATSLHSTDDRGRTLYVVEGHRGLAKLWAQNMPVNSLEDERCKRLGDATVDPRQFVISLSPRFWVSGNNAIMRAHADLRSAVTAAGYRVLDAPVACSFTLDG